MNIGTICYATRSGLGHLAKMFYDNGIINRFCELPHLRYTSQAHIWYRPEDYHYSLIEDNLFLQDLDILIIFENAFHRWDLVRDAKEQGTKFVLIPMYEWTPNPLPVEPDLVICPSLLDVDYFHTYNYRFINIPAPNPKEIPWKERIIANDFVHNAGHGQVNLTKGTPEVLEAFAHHVKSDAQLLVRGQEREPRVKEILYKYRGFPNIQIEHGDIFYTELFSRGDVFINAERYNGLSLPLQEAYSAGMLVMTTDRFPMNTWLPNDPLIPVKSCDQFILNQTKIDRALIDPEQIARCVDKWYGQDIRKYSLAGKHWAEEHSWANLKPLYMSVLSNIK